MAERRRVPVVAALVRRGDRFLVTKRLPGGTFGGFWEFPGGKVEAGERDEDALVREIQEELGAPCRVLGPYLFLVHEYPSFTLDFRVYVCEVGDELQPLGVAEIRWVDVAQSEALTFPPADLPVLERIRGESVGAVGVRA